MSVAALELPARTTAGEDDELCHLVCCCTGDNIAACGKDVSSDPWVEDDDVLDCVVCTDLWPLGAPCPRCGCEECS